MFLGDSEWTLYRAAPNNSFRDGNTNGNAIAFKTADWKIVETTEILVPYKTTLHMPVVMLENLDTGAVIRVIAVHNPASTAKAGNQQASRNNARAIEIAAMSGAARGGPRHPDHHRRRHERAGDGVLLLHRHRLPAVLRRRLGRRRLQPAAARPGRLDLLDARPGLPSQSIDTSTWAGSATTRW